MSIEPNKHYVRAMCRLWDKGPNTRTKLGVATYTLNKLVEQGYAYKIEKRPLTFVGITMTLYSLSDKGRRHLIAVGKRFDVDKHDNKH